MTLIAALRSHGAIILAADSRGTVGDPRGLTAINDTQEKIYRLGNCGLGLAGASEMGAVLLDELHKKGIDRIGNIDALVALVVKECGENFNQWFQGISPGQRPAVLLSLAGYRFADGEEPKPMIYMLNSQLNFAPQLFNNAPCLIGVPQYAVYLVHRYYDLSISTEKAKALAVYLISETASQDPKVGGPIKVAVISPQEGYQELSQDDVNQIMKSNEELNVELRQFFQKGEI